MQLYSASEIQANLARMAGEAATAIRHRDPIVIPVLLGGVFTAVGLSAHFDFPYEFDRLQVTRYRHALTGGELEWLIEPSRSLAGRCVLVVDDIIDRGITLRVVTERLRSLGAGPIYSAVLVDKQVPDGREMNADFIGVTCEDVYVFGCGMDYLGRWRGLPALYGIKPK